MSLNHDSISNLYHEWQTFSSKIFDNRKIGSPKPIIIQEPLFQAKDGTTDEVTFDVALKFMDIPCRATQSKCRNIEIYLKSRITYRITGTNTKNIINYSTSVQYCKKEGKTLNCIMGYRYDGNDLTIQYGHPIFHMHFKNDVLHSVISEAEVGKFENINRVDTSEMDEIHIPTAQMDFYNTIVSLFADHLYTDKGKLTKVTTLGKFNTFLTSMEPILVKCTLIREKLFECGPQTESCMSNRWYPIKIHEEEII